MEDGKKVETIHKDVADHIMVQGKLQSGAVFSISVSLSLLFGGPGNVDENSGQGGTTFKLGMGKSSLKKVRFLSKLLVRQSSGATRTMLLPSSNMKMLLEKQKDSDCGDGARGGKDTIKDGWESLRSIRNWWEISEL